MNKHHNKRGTIKKKKNTTHLNTEHAVHAFVVCFLIAFLFQTWVTLNNYFYKQVSFHNYYQTSPNLIKHTQVFKK